MTSRYQCVHCDLRFDDPADKPRCPKCMRRNGVEFARSPVAQKGRRFSSKYIALGSLALLAAGIGIWAVNARGPSLQEVDPQALALFTLEPDAVAFARAQGDTLEQRAMSALASLSKRRWWPSTMPTHALDRDVRSAAQMLASQDDETRDEVYPLESAVLFTALIRQQGIDAVVGECWSLGGERTPLDSTAVIGYHVVAARSQAAQDETKLWLDPFAGTKIDPVAAKCRLLKDTEVVGAAMGLRAHKAMTHDFDASEALDLVTKALKLDPRSPQLRLTHALVLLNAGGVQNAFDEMRSAVQIRGDASTQTSLAELHLARAGMANASGMVEGVAVEVEAAGALAAQALKTYPDYARAKVTLASVHIATGDDDRARLLLEEAERVDPGSTDLAIGWVQYYIEIGEFEKAKTAMSKALANGKSGWRLHLQAAQVYGAVGDRDRMLVQVDAAIESVPSERRPMLREQITATLGPDAFDDNSGVGLPELPDSQMPMADPSEMKLRDPGDGLELKLSE